MFYACRVRLSIQPIHAESLAQREERDTYEEEWRDREAALFFHCFVHVPERILKPNTQKNE